LFCSICRNLIENSPVPLVSVVVVPAGAVSVAVTEAAETIAPLGSVTAPDLVHSDPAPGFITCDDADSTARKVAYALEVLSLGGVFMWELSGDYDGKQQGIFDSMSRIFKRIKREGH
jgi:hypothetical protein